MGILRVDFHFHSKYFTDYGIFGIDDESNYRLCAANVFCDEDDEEERASDNEDHIDYYGRVCGDCVDGKYIFENKCIIINGDESVSEHCFWISKSKCVVTCSSVLIMTSSVRVYVNFYFFIYLCECLRSFCFLCIPKQLCV